MAEGVLYTIAGEVLKTSGSRVIDEIASGWGIKPRLEKLKNSIYNIRNVLLDAEEKQADSLAVREWLQRLATAVYAADDLFDEFNTIASRKQLLGGNKVTKEVKTFFSHSNQIALAFKFSRKIKAVREELESIYQDGSHFGLATRVIEQGRLMAGIRRDETSSYVDVKEVIGRDTDKKTILDLLLVSTSTNEEHEVPSVLPIVGLGGMGKTTLAQLVFHDPRVNESFELKLWVCVAEDFDIKVITEKILRSATDTESPKLDLDQLQKRLREKVSGKRYLLVLDDVWEENPDKWEKLKVHLKVGKNGSKVLVTTRSEKVAKIMSIFPHHELQGLSEDESWDLFKKTACRNGESPLDARLVKMGKEVIKKCANLPLAIVTLGRLLWDKDESKWSSIIKNIDLTDVMNVLKLSYQHLLSPLKNCFAYCALFPKDYRFEKELLIELWIAEGFITPSAKGQILEDVAEDYFHNLLQRGFFQELYEGDETENIFYNMHDLIHDLAQREAEVKCKVVKLDETDWSDKILHLSFAESLPSSWEIPNSVPNMKMLRTILLPNQRSDGPCFSKSVWHQVVTKFNHLRVLDLQYLGFTSLPTSIGKLIHLRYLNLCNTPIQKLPDSITSLHNLQTLDLRFCSELRTLPSKIHKLVNLRILDVSYCDNVTHMPSGIGGMTLLYKLPVFIVNYKQSAELRKKPTSTAKLSDLKKLNNLRGDLVLQIHGSSVNNMSEATEADITNKHGLIKLKISFDLRTTFEADKKKHDEVVLEGLKPHCNLKRLTIVWYGGQKLPNWAVMNDLGKTLPNLVKIHLSSWGNCQQVPTFSQLHSLKSLRLISMERVEYMECGELCTSSSSSSNLFFPSLEILKLENMENLKGWWKQVLVSTVSNDETSGKHHRHHLSSMQFSKLSHLDINECPNLKFLPLCPNLDTLDLIHTNKDVLSQWNMVPISSSSSSSNWSGLKLQSLRIGDVENLFTLSNVGMNQLSNLVLSDENLQSTERLGGIFATLSSLESLFLNCKLSENMGLEHLTRLERLALYNCADAHNMPWRALKTGPRNLELYRMSKLVSLPSEIQHLTNVRSLHIENMEELREIPEWISCLSSLQYLKLNCCPKLTTLPQGIQKLTSLNQLTIERCQGLIEECQYPNGSQWPKIQHIACVVV